MNELVFIFVVSALSGLVLVILGYLIAVKGKYTLINGVDFALLSDVEAFGRDVGWGIFWSGWAMVAAGVLVYLEIVGLILYLVLIMLASIAPLPIFFKAKKKYTRATEQ